MKFHALIKSTLKRLKLVKNSTLGFTLIELMVVIVILGILAGLIIPRIMGRPDEAKQLKAKMQIESLETELATTEEEGLKLLALTRSINEQIFLEMIAHEGKLAKAQEKIDEKTKATKRDIEVISNVTKKTISAAVLNGSKPAVRAGWLHPFPGGDLA